MILIYHSSGCKFKLFLGNAKSFVKINTTFFKLEKIHAFRYEKSKHLGMWEAQKF